MIQSTKGYSLIEVLVAIAILLVATVGPMTIASRSMQSASFSNEKTTALFLAQEGIEAFIAIRNDKTIEAFAAGDISTSWDWVTGPDIAKCLGAQGCNTDFASDNPLNDIVSCSPPGNCRVDFNEASPRARYSTHAAGGTESPYTRVIVLTPDTVNKGIKIESTVSWESHLFGGAEQKVILNGAIFNLYE